MHVFFLLKTENDKSKVYQKILIKDRLNPEPCYLGKPQNTVFLVAILYYELLSKYEQDNLVVQFLCT